MKEIERRKSWADEEFGANGNKDSRAGLLTKRKGDEVGGNPIME